MLQFWRTQANVGGYRIRKLSYKCNHLQLCPDEMLILLSTGVLCSVMWPSVVTPWTVACQAPVHGISQARILKRAVVFSSLRGPSQPRDRTASRALAGGCFTTEPAGKSHWSFISSVQSLVVSNSLRPCGLKHTRRPSPSPTPRACSNSCPLSQWWHPTISSSVIPFSSDLLSFSASGCFPMSQFFTSSGQSIGASASVSVLPVNIQDWFLLGLTPFGMWLCTKPCTVLCMVLCVYFIIKYWFLKIKYALLSMKLITLIHFKHNICSQDSDFCTKSKGLGQSLALQGTLKSLL